MGFQTRRGSPTVAIAAAQAIADTRKAASICVAIQMGTATLVGGTVTVSGATTLNAASKIAATANTPGGTQGILSVPQASRTAGTSFVINSSNGADTSTVDWTIETPLFHADKTAAAITGDYLVPAQTLLTVTAANAVDLPSSITLANQMRQVILLMYADATAHLAADTTNGATLTALGTVLADTITLANAEKTSLNAHFTQTGVHVNNDSVNTVSTTNASDLPSLQTLLNAIKTNLNAHLASAPAGESVIVGAS